MNPLLSHLQPYPFERLRQLFVGVTPNPAYTPISLGIGEPKHPTPEFIKEALTGSLSGLATYPATAGEPKLRDAFRRWLMTRYGLAVDANTQMLPVNGTREALFAFAQTVIDPTDKDMQLRPDPSTVRIVPWATDPTAQVIHDCFDHAGNMVPFAPRSVLRRVCDLFAAAGLQPIVAPELEFYLTARNTDPNTLLRAPVGRSGRAETSRQAYSIDAVNEFDPLFEEIYEYSDKMELNVDTLIHEVGAGQMEINFFHAHPLGLADEVFERTVQYLKERRQFGAAIGSFQAVQHRLVEMLVALEQARSLAWLLATEFDFATPERRSVLASAAKVRCIASSRFVGLQSIHLHGGMGMTDVLPIGRGVKRLLAIENSFGNEAHHLARITRASLATTP